MVYWLLHVFSPWFSLLVNVIGATVLMARLFLKLAPAAKNPESKYAKVRNIASHVALQLGSLESQI